jgi:hypothetical protein
MIKKTCINCSLEKDICIFSKSSRNKDGLDNVCKICQRERGLKYRLGNINNPKISGDTKKCGKCFIYKKLTDFGTRKGSKDGFNNVCKICKKIRGKKYYEDNKEKSLMTMKKYLDKNKEKKKLYDKEYRIKNKERRDINRKKYNENNRDKLNQWYRNKKETDILFKLNHTMRNRIRNFLKIKNWDKQKSTYDMIGCSPEFLKEHLEKQFKDTMSWENKGEWHIDHIIPLSSAKTEDELYEICHYTNLQPLWANENLKKGKNYEIKK